MKHKFLYTIGLCAVLAAGSLTPGCAGKKLETGGAYAAVTSTNSAGQVSTTLGQAALFAADSTFDMANTAMDTAFGIEKKNRALIWKLSPDVKHTLDKIRPQAVDARRRYAIARAEYISNPHAGNLTVLQSVLSEISSISAAATAGISAAAAAATATTAAQ